MVKHITNHNIEVTNFLDELNHPLTNEIERLRNCILKAINTNCPKNQQTIKSFFS